MKKIFALAMVVVMALALCACGEKGGTPANSGGNSFEGEWESTKIEYEGETITGEAAAGFVFVIAADGTGNCTINGDDAGEITWVSNGNSITITDDVGDVVTGELKGEKLVFNNFAGQGIDVEFSRK